MIHIRFERASTSGLDHLLADTAFLGKNFIGLSSDLYFNKQSSR